MSLAPSDPHQIAGPPAPSRRRLRTAVASTLALVLTATLLGAAPTSTSAAVDPYDTTAVVARITDLEAQLRAQTAQVDATAAELTRGTRRYEEGQAALARTQEQAREAQERADAAARQVDEARRRLDAVANSTYRSPMPSELDLLLSSNGDDFTDVLAAASLLRRAGTSNADVLREVTVARTVADDSTALAERLVADADDQAAALAVQVTELRTIAERSAAAMTATVSRLDDAQAEKERLDAARAAAEEAARIAAEEAARKAAEEAARQAAEAARQAAEAAARERDAARRAAAEARARELAERASRAVPKAPSAPAAPAVVVVSGSGCAGGSVSGYPNGQLPRSALCPLDGASGHVLRSDAAAAFNAMTAAYRADTGDYLCVTDSYRTYSQQVDVYSRKPGLAAVPGTSNHGWGKALDLCGGAQSFSGSAHQWLRANAGRFGWENPSWAQAGGSKPEPWHWEF